MSRSKGRRGGTRGGRRGDGGETDPFERVQLPRPKAKGRLPSDIADAAEAALDDILARTDETEAPATEEIADDDEPRTQTRAPSHDDIVPDDEEDDEILTSTARNDDTSARTGQRRSKIPLPAPPRTTSVHTLDAPPPAGRASPVPRPSPSPAPRPSPSSLAPSPASRPSPSSPASRPSPSSLAPSPTSRPSPSSLAPAPSRPSPIPAPRTTPPPPPRPTPQAPPSSSPGRMSSPLPPLATPQGRTSSPSSPPPLAPPPGRTSSPSSPPPLAPPPGRSSSPSSPPPSTSMRSSSPSTVSSSTPTRPSAPATSSGSMPTRSLSPSTSSGSMPTRPSAPSTSSGSMPTRPSAPATLSSSIPTRPSAPAASSSSMPTRSLSPSPSPSSATPTRPTPSPARPPSSPFSDRPVEHHRVPSAYDDLSVSEGRGPSSFDDLSASESRDPSSFDDLSVSESRDPSSFDDLSVSESRDPSSFDERSSDAGRAYSVTDDYPITSENVRGQSVIDELPTFLPRVRGLSAIDDLLLPTVPPTRRPGSRGSTAAETPQTRAEMTTSERGPSVDDSLLGISSVDGVLASFAEETNSVPEELPFDIDSGPVSADPDELVPVRPELASLQVVVYEESAQLATAQGAIVAAGHVVAQGGSGRDGLARVLDAIRGGGIDVVLVALPGGEQIIDAALALEPRRPVVIASLPGSAVDAIERAHVAGADLAITRPHDVERLAPLVHAAARLLFEKRMALVARGAEQVLRARIDELVDPEPRGLLPFEMFQRVLELEIKRARRFEYPLSVALFAVEVAPPPPPAGIRGILRARAGTALIHTIRDIDMATQLDHERFLVLLPYTDLKGSANLGRRVIAAVAEGDPVVAGGRSFPPRVVGAVAGGAPGQALSFAKLMKDATRALEQARRDGAELAVQP